MTLHIVGVRHHSPACARLVRDTILRVQPLHVLIEGPADFNARIDELRLPHALPVALFTYYRDEQRMHASWTPFCEYSPEWVALTVGHDTGAQVRFCDLPAWHPTFAGRRNRYADEQLAPDAGARWEAQLLERFRLDGTDALWDHLFELPLPLPDLERRLTAYFVALRGDAPGGERDAPREALMSRYAAWAVADADHSGRDVVLICGGWHAPQIERAARTIAAPATEPQIEPPSETHARYGSYLVPYSYKRLDSFTGYESGMPSPGYYDALWRHGAEHAPERMLQAITSAVRARKQAFSTADMVACMSFGESIARLRGHASVARTDLLDALAATMIKDGLEVPLPWSERGVLRRGTDPLLVAIVETLSGAREGKLAPGTPQPPLVADVRALLDQYDLRPTASPHPLTLKLTQPRELERSRILHRLRVLEISGFKRERGPERATDPELTEVWILSESERALSDLIEAGAYGHTLETAAMSRLEEMLMGAAGHIAALAQVFTEAAFAGLPLVAQRILPQLQSGVAVEPSFNQLGAAAAQLMALFEHGELYGMIRSLELARVLEAVFDRGLWLCEGIQGSAAADKAQLGALGALRDIYRYGPPALSLPGARAHGVMHRKCADGDAPPALRGAALGFVWSTGAFADTEAAKAQALQTLQSASTPHTVGDFLAGLFALAREECLTCTPLIEAIDRVIGNQHQTEFLVALPALRLAFSYFPPQERETIARGIYALYGEDSARVRLDLRLEVSAETLARGIAFDAQIDRIVQRFALD